MDPARASIERALAKTRKNGLGQIASGAFGTTMFVVFVSSPTVSAIFVALNALMMMFMGRRLWRLRKRGPLVRALLEAPADVAAIHQWPLKLPPNAKAAGIDIVTTGGAKGFMLVDSKDTIGTSQLVEALRSRSPNAALVWDRPLDKLAPPSQ